MRRNDGAPAYNLAVVVDDAAQGIGEVVRGDDLARLDPAPAAARRRLGLPAPSYAHVPLVLGADGARLAKRHGGVTLRELDPEAALAWMVRSLDMRPASDPLSLLAAFDPARIPREPVVWEGL